MQDAWDTSVAINVDGEDVRYFHTRKSGVDRIWIDRYWSKATPSKAERWFLPLPSTLFCNLPSTSKSLHFSTHKRSLQLSTIAVYGLSAYFNIWQAWGWA